MAVTILEGNYGVKLVVHQGGGYTVITPAGQELPAGWDLEVAVNLLLDQEEMAVKTPRSSLLDEWDAKMKACVLADMKHAHEMCMVCYDLAKEVPLLSEEYLTYTKKADAFSAKANDLWSLARTLS